MKLTYKIRLFLWFLIIFVAFALVMIIVEQREEKKYRTQALETELNNYTEIIHSFIEKNKLISQNEDLTGIESLLQLFPSEMRITLIKDNGTVLFDNDKDIASASDLQNHLDRPEIMRALYQQYGSNIRLSASTEHEYLYYAKFYNTYFVRVALPYDVKVQGILRPDRMFIYVAVLMLIAGLILLNIVAGRFSKSIRQLKQLSTTIKDGKPLTRKLNFPDDELGEIGAQLNEIFRQKEKHEKELEFEREKIVKHFQFSKNGLCIFNSNRIKVYCNTLFMQYLNVITDGLTSNTDIVFSDKKFEPVQQFLKGYAEGKLSNNFVYKVLQDGKVFEIQTVIFEDNSFEIGIKDITESEQTSRMKQEMTNNIAHELRTPVTSLRGYLETLDTQNLDSEKLQQFIHRAYVQSIRLSNIVEDIGLISKMEEATQQFKIEKLDIAQVVNDVRIDLTDKLEKNKTSLEINIKKGTLINGNYTLLYSIFRNLIENSLDHGGDSIKTFINNYLEDDKFLYFSYYDTGKGVKDEHLNRIFERFYRADEGRTREKGGSGLGLSIVRNAIKFHHGEIQVKNRKEGGLEFLFTIKK